ncbi:MAG: tRNA (adenosine(37)-N6)-threonylcarbamoyltransferase complex dimerization subunit type 1 TsaB [Marinoscillum sp.]
MALILSLDTSTKVCSVAVHDDGELIGQQSYHLQKSHSSLLPLIIEQVMDNCEFKLSQLAAIALSAGPGSYTGLRIGTATAKGLTYALNIPLIALDSLDTMIEQIRPIVDVGSILCPMIDARRMEVYCKLVEQHEIWPTAPLVVEADTFDEIKDGPLIFFGNGSDKLKALFPNVRYVPDVHPSAAHMGRMAFDKFKESDFEDIAYFEPDYLKEYRTNVPSQKFKV